MPLNFFVSKTKAASISKQLFIINSRWPIYMSSDDISEFFIVHRIAGEKFVELAVADVFR